jgi:hypothetical protein
MTMLTDARIDEMRLLSWPDAQKAMEPLPSHRLVELFDHRFSKVADTASQLLTNRNDESIIVKALLAGQIRTSLGKLRAVNTLLVHGMSCPAALQAYQHMLSDRGYHVVDAALFGLVFLGHVESVPLIEERIRTTKQPKMLAVLKLALRAIMKDDPYLFCPEFSRSAIRRWRKHLTPKMEKAARAAERIERS